MAPVLVFAGADAFGESLKNAAVEHLRSKADVEVVDLGTGSYYGVAEQVARELLRTSREEVSTAPDDQGRSEKSSLKKDIRGLLVCGTGAGVNLVANKFQGVSAVCCDSVDAAKDARSINNCNVLSLSGLHTKLESAPAIIDAWLETDFKAPCPANRNAPWNAEISSFLDKSIPDINALSGAAPTETCPICSLASERVYADVAEMPGGSWTVVRDSPTTAMVRFRKGSIEPLHHHTFSHDIAVIAGHKLVQNVTKEQSFTLKAGDFLSTPAGNRHRVYYYEDTEFFIRFEGKADIVLDESSEAAAAALKGVVPGHCAALKGVVPGH